MLRIHYSGIEVKGVKDCLHHDMNYDGWDHCFLGNINYGAATLGGLYFQR